MKIITLHKPVQIDQLYNLLQQKLKLFFQEQRKTDMELTIAKAGNTIEISLPEKYEGVLFSIGINGTELLIKRSEHYVDDVNSLTIESILNSLFEDVAGNLGTDLVKEG